MQSIRSFSHSCVLNLSLNMHMHVMDLSLIFLGSFQNETSLFCAKLICFLASLYMCDNMASATKRPRKFCTACKLEFSDRHFRRHVENCGNDKINLSSSNACTSSYSNTDDDAHQESPLFSDEEEVMYKNYDYKKKKY